MQSQFSISEDAPLASAPEKFVLRTSTAKAPDATLLKDIKQLVYSKKLEPKITPLVLELVDDRNEPR